MPELDPEFLKFLNLLDGAPTFTIRIDPKIGKCTVHSPSAVPDNDGEYLIQGVTVMACGAQIGSVFHVDTNSGGTLIAVYWKTNTGWIDSQDELAAARLEKGRDEIFPYDWSFAVPLENDVFHPKAP